MTLVRRETAVALQLLPQPCTGIDDRAALPRLAQTTGDRERRGTSASTPGECHDPVSLDPHIDLEFVTAHRVLDARAPQTRPLQRAGSARLACPGPQGFAHHGAVGVRPGCTSTAFGAARS